ncbi:MAG TPA: hypothetical protein VGQ42_10070 [Candidatus Dormibacteraeota bacterium]|jgi:hypothetical protein|nr:hypothetical protein [Candidatus Dormibacteraeota bacterium]
MDFTPTFFDRWREHRHLQYVDRVREVFDEAVPDEEWLAGARVRAKAKEAVASLKHSGVEVGEEEGVVRVLGEGATDDVGPVDVAAVRAFGDAYDAALAAAAQGAALTPALVDDLHARLCAAAAGRTDNTTDPALAELTAWVESPPDDMHPVLVAAVAELELLRMRRWDDGNGRLARMVLLLLLHRSGYGYKGLIAPSTGWHDPRDLPGGPAEELSPEEAETHPGVERAVGGIADAVRDMVAWVRAEESPGSWQAVFFANPVQP